MKTFIMEQYHVVLGRAYVEAPDMDAAIIKAHNGLDVDDLEYFFDTAEPAVDDRLKLRSEESGVDEWTVAKERAREMGYCVEADVEAGEFADRLYRVARNAEGSVHERIETAWHSFFFAPNIPYSVTSEARRLAMEMIEQGGAMADQT